MDGMSCKALGAFLSQKFSFNEEVLTKFLEEEIDGEAYMGLTEATMINQLKLKAGQVIKITKHIHSLCYQKLHPVSDCILPLASNTLIEAEPSVGLIEWGSVEPLSSSHSSFDVSDIKLHATNFLLCLTASSSMTLYQVEFVKNSVSEMFSATIDKLKESVTSLVNQLPSTAPYHEAHAFIDELSTLGNPFADVSSVYKLEKYVARLPSFVPPVEHVLGQRWEGSDRQQHQKLKNDTFMYMSLEATLKHVLHWQKSWEEMIDLNSIDDDGIEISSYFCGSNFKKIYKMIKDKINVQFYPIVLQLYYDDFETVNPIGTKTGLHKLGGFYFTIVNFLKKHNSKLNNINLVQLAYRADIVKYGMQCVLAPLRNELLRLEKGFDVVLEDGSIRHVVCILGQVVADDLGLHGLLGYTESFSHSCACDLCFATKDEVQSVFASVASVCEIVSCMMNTVRCWPSREEANHMYME